MARAITRRRTSSSYLAYAAPTFQVPGQDGGADPEGWAQALEPLRRRRRLRLDHRITMQRRSAYGRDADPRDGQARRPARPFRPSRVADDRLRRRPRIRQTTSDFTVTAAEVVGPLWPLRHAQRRALRSGPGDVDGHERRWRASSMPMSSPDQPIWYGKYVTVVPDVERGQPGRPARQPRRRICNSALGWIYVFQRLARACPVRDFLWLP